MISVPTPISRAGQQTRGSRGRPPAGLAELQRVLILWTRPDEEARQVDFSPDEAQRAVTHAAAGVLERAGAPAPDQPCDWALWRQLEQAGRLSLTVTGVLPVVRWGDREAQAAVLAGVAEGDTVLTAAIREPSEPMPESPRTTVTPRSCSGSSVSGLKVGVPAAAHARWVLVPAIATAGLGLPRVPR